MVSASKAPRRGAIKVPKEKKIGGEKKKMKTKTIAFLAIAAVVMSAATMGAVMAAKKDTCTTIQEGTLLTSDGEVITTGYDQWGYNYQAHMFNGYYCDSYRDAEWCQPYKDVELMMKWNDAWLSNKDCDCDGLLDRHYGYESYIGSGAWLTNHQSGTYVNDDGKTCNWNYFVKIVAVPDDADLIDGIWHTADGTVIGYDIWGEFAVIEEVENDPCAGVHGIQYKPASPGLGCYQP